MEGKGITLKPVHLLLKMEAPLQLLNVISTQLFSLLLWSQCCKYSLILKVPRLEKQLTSTVLQRSTYTMLPSNVTTSISSNVVSKKKNNLVSGQICCSNVCTNKIHMIKGTKVTLASKLTVSDKEIMNHSQKRLKYLQL